MNTIATLAWWYFGIGAVFAALALSRMAKGFPDELNELRDLGGDFIFMLATLWLIVFVIATWPLRLLRVL